MNKRKILGTIIGLIFWSFCVVFFTYAYYDWKSEATNVVLGIEDLSVECLVGANVDVSNIGPVLNYKDGVKADFSIKNPMADNMAIELSLDITNISDNLLTESVKYVLVTDATGGNSYDYNNPIVEGDFKYFDIGSNLITQAIEVKSSITQHYQFIIYIDGNMYNNPNIQENELNANLMIGNCGEDAIPMNEMVYQAIYSESDHSLTFIHDKSLKVGDTYNEKVVSAVYTGFETNSYNRTTLTPWYQDNNYQKIEIINFEAFVKPKSTAFWFYGFSNLISINLEKLDTSNVTSMEGMFYNCSSLKELDLSNFDTSNVNKMNDWGTGMFSGCSNLKELDLSNFNTSKVNTMVEMFKGCTNLMQLDVSNFNTSNVTNMVGMFAKCSNLISLDVSRWDTSKVNNMGEWDNGIFSGCSSLKELDVSGWDTSSTTSMYEMFSGCSSLEKLDVSKFNVSKVTSMSFMFSGCSSLKKLDVGGWNTSKVTKMDSMFYNCRSLKELDLSNFDTSKVTSMYQTFYECSSLKELDLSEWNTGSTTSMYQMFSGCSSLEKLDVSGWNTTNVTNIGAVFSNCSSLKELDVSEWDTGNIVGTDYWNGFANAFYGCSSLEELDLSGWDTSNVTNMNGMFLNCSSLKELDVSSFNTSNVTDMSEMFYLCRNISNLNISNFDTSNVKNMNKMFNSCFGVVATITISNNNITNYTNMFNQASTNSNAKIIVNYTPETSSLVDSMIATKSSNSNVVKGVCIGDNCPII